jgi:predicted nucleic acid-binding Zn ribbon protein
VDLSAVKKTGGDYNLKQLAAAVGGAALNGRIVQTWQKKAAGRKTVAFAVDIAHAETIVRSFHDAGVRAEIVTGDTPKAERDGVLARLAHGITTIVVNVGVLTEGWDLPALECAIVARPTASLCLHLQQIGRIMRSCDGKEGAIVLDHAGNYDRHGLVTDRLVYSLDGKVKKAPGIAPTKTCPECAKVVPAGVHVCPECGHEFPREDKTQENDAELLPVGHGDTFDERARRWARFYTEASRIASWKFHGDMFSPEAKGLGFTIASAKFKARYGAYPLAYDGRLLNPQTATPQEWAHMRERWREIGTRKGWPAKTTEWFVGKCEKEARGGKVGAA